MSLDPLDLSASFSQQPTFNFCPVDGRQFDPYETRCPLCETEREMLSFSQRMLKSSLNGAEFGNVNAQIPSEASPLDGRLRRKWKKLLYVRQAYPDNYVDHTFLEEMQKNANARSYEYWQVVRESGVITQHFSSIAIFIAAFVHIYSHTLSVHKLIVIANLLTAGGYAFWSFNISRTIPDYRQSQTKTLKGALLFFTTLLGLSPILKTLTLDTSDDTIWALTVCLFFVNLFFHDYGSENTTNIKYPGSLSCNAAIFSSVLLASRLPSNLHVFGLMLFAVEWFALFPILRRSIKRASVVATVLLTLMLCAVSVFLLWGISKAVLIAYIVAVLFTTFVCPFWLIWIQRYKNEINGPWDEARLVLSSTNLNK